MAVSEARLTEADAQPVRTPKAAAGAAGRAKTPSPSRSQRTTPARPDLVQTDAHPSARPPADEPVDAHMSDEDRFALFVDNMTDSVLPDLPPIPGYHVCWLTTTNPRDPVARRLRAGYELLRVEDFPEYSGLSLKTGDYQGVIGINEMVAAKIPEAAYQRGMQVLHHDRPLDQEAKLRSVIDSMKEQAARAKSGIVEEGDGTADLGKGTSAPRFVS